MAFTIKDYINSFRTKLADTITKQQIEPVKKNDRQKRKTILNNRFVLVTI